MVEKEFRRGFIARLLLFSASQLDGVQGSTTSGNCAANMTFGTVLEASKKVKVMYRRRIRRIPTSRIGGRRFAANLKNRPLRRSLNHAPLKQIHPIAHQKFG